MWLKFTLTHASIYTDQWLERNRCSRSQNYTAQNAYVETATRMRFVSPAKRVPRVSMHERHIIDRMYHTSEPNTDEPQRCPIICELVADPTC